MYWLENWYNPPCRLDASRAPIYDVFACRLEGEFFEDDMELPRHLRNRVIGWGGWTMILGPYYSRHAMLDLRVTSCDSCLCFFTDPYFATMMIAVPGTHKTLTLRTRHARPLTVHPSPMAACGGFLAAATLAKYDAPYMIEWIEYHQKLGVEHFYIYNNGSADITRVLAPLVASGLVTEIPWPHPYKVYEYQWHPWWPTDSHLYCQPPQQMHAIRRFGHNWTWMMMTDCDEFMVPGQERYLVPLLEQYDSNAVSGLEVRGRWFGNNRLHGPPVGSVVDRYTRCEPGYTAATKLIVSPKNVRAMLIHWANSPYETVPIDPDVLTFHHYAAVSAHHSRWSPAYDGQHNAVENRRAIEVRDL
ncbi:MAG: glycosyltransferase family 92 protein [Phycisphaerae bacterium]